MKQTIRQFVDLVARGDYDAAVAAGNGQGLSPEDLREEVEAYGFELAPPGAGWWDLVEVTPISGSDPPEFHVAAPLWEPGGRSELTLELELKQVSEDTWRRWTACTCCETLVGGS